jgi:hypothetical protein
MNRPVTAAAKAHAAPVGCAFDRPYCSLILYLRQISAATNAASKAIRPPLYHLPRVFFTSNLVSG